jgi:hypothetical protein
MIYLGGFYATKKQIGDVAEEYSIWTKAKGNECYKKGDYSMALRCFNAASAVVKDEK